ncbi:MAG: c-type cytochrome domain-containing protein [Pirellulaceae bacterium]
MMFFHTRWLSAICLILCLLQLTAITAQAEEPETASPSGKISYFKQIRPILQANCQGCHQPAKRGGDYEMTQFETLLAGGESGEPAIVAEQPDASYLMELITPVEGEAQMPQGKPPLKQDQVALIGKWIEQGATDDTPESAKARYNQENPPVYAAPPVLTSLDISPDGAIIAVSGYHEVLLHNSQGTEIVGRLVGMSERIESVKFSPDGTKLAVAGGSPGRMGELQVWDVAQRELLFSASVTYDTIYGASWSPDGGLIAVGCGDNTVRAFKAEDGTQVFFNGAHEDWVFSTVFSVDGKNLVSVGRDMTARLHEVATQRFIDNITSITPGALKGGLHAVARHPTKDEVLLGGADGIPKLYQMFRTKDRKIGDDFNLIRAFPAMPGRVYDVGFNAEASRAVACSSFNGVGHVHVVDVEKGTLLKELEGPLPATYTVRFDPTGKTIFSGGFDGTIRVHDAETGELLRQFSATPVDLFSAVTR